MPRRIHISAIDRIAHGVDDYAPENLPPNVEVVTTPPDARQDGALIAARARNVEAVCNRALGNGSVLESLHGTVLVGWLSYYVFLVACTAAALGLVFYGADDRSAAGLLGETAHLVGGAMSKPLDTAVEADGVLRAHVWLFSSIVAALALSSVMSRATDRHARNVSSAFWHEHQPELRAALKAARKEVMTETGGLGSPLCWGSAAAAARGESALV
jgi:hypothetical protein